MNNLSPYQSICVELLTTFCNVYVKNKSYQKISVESFDYIIRNALLGTYASTLNPVDKKNTIFKAIDVYHNKENQSLQDYKISVYDSLLMSNQVKITNNEKNIHFEHIMPRAIVFARIKKLIEYHIKTNTEVTQNEIIKCLKNNKLVLLNKLETSLLDRKYENFEKWDIDENILSKELFDDLTRKLQQSSFCFLRQFMKCNSEILVRLYFLSKCYNLIGKKFQLQLGRKGNSIPFETLIKTDENAIIKWEDNKIFVNNQEWIITKKSTKTDFISDLIEARKKRGVAINEEFLLDSDFGLSYKENNNLVYDYFNSDWILRID